MLVPEAVLLEHLGRKMIQRDLYSFDGTVSDDIATLPPLRTTLDTWAMERW